MTFTSSSNYIAKLENIDLSFTLPVFHSDSIRNMFTSALSHPLKYFRSRPKKLSVFENLSLKVKEGDRIGLVGPNGVGKTSLCRIIAGVYRPQKGKVVVDGHVRAIFDTSIGIHPELTGRENANMLAEFLYPLTPDKKSLVEECLEFSELGEFLDTPFKYYSNGMKSRLCLSLVSAQANDLLILDEVFDGADQFFRKKITKRIIDLIEGCGSVIFVSHSFQQIKTVCNRVVVLKNGAIVYDGSPDIAEKIYTKGFVH